MARVTTVEECTQCTKLMKDPRILPCGHSFCLKCLESLALHKCPRCELVFKTPRGGLKNLKKNKFIEHLIAFSKKLPQCNICNKNKAVKFCNNCSNNYCPACLLSHQSIKNSKKHKWITLEVLQDESKIEHEYGKCKDHADVINLFCKSCDSGLCGHCLTKHKECNFIPFSEHFKAIKNKLEQKLRENELSLMRVTSNYKKSTDMLNDSETRAEKVKKQIDQRADDLKKVINSIAEDLKRSIDDSLKSYKQGAEVTLSSLKGAELHLTGQIEILQQRLNTLNYENALETDTSNCIQAENEVVHSKTFYLELLHEVADQKTTLEEIFGALRKEPQYSIVTKHSLSGHVKSLTADQKVIFVSRWHDSKIEILNRDNLSHRSSFDCKKFLSEVHDLLIVEDVLFILGKCNDGVRIVKRESDLKEVCMFSHQGHIFKLSHGHCYNSILLVTSNELTLLDVKGRVLKKTFLSFPIYDALQIEGGAYVVCTDENILILESGGNEVKAYSPLNEGQTMKFPRCLARDEHGNFYIGDNYYEKKKILTLSPDLLHLYTVDVDIYLHVIRYDKQDRNLLAMTDCSLLKIQL